MALIQTAWIMGSAPDVPETDISVTVNGVTEDLSIPAGGYYLWDGDESLSALDVLSVVLEGHSELGIGDVSAVVGRDRRPRFTTPYSWRINSWSDQTFRDILGFTGTEAFLSLTQAPSGFSDYLWSPGRCEIPDAPLGHPGLPYHDTAVGVSGDAVAIATTNNSGRKNRFRFPYVRVRRVMTSAQARGEYEGFWDRVVRRFHRWKLYREITEEETATDVTDVALVSADVLGPYKFLAAPGLIELGYQRDVSGVEMFSTIELPALEVPDY